MNIRKDELKELRNFQEMGYRILECTGGVHQTETNGDILDNVKEVDPSLLRFAFDNEP